MDQHLQSLAVSDPPTPSPFFHPSPLSTNLPSNSAYQTKPAGPGYPEPETSITGLPSPSHDSPYTDSLPLKADSAAITEAMEQNIPMWNEYNELAESHEKEFVKGANEDLNTLLIFAGLFAAINAAFIIETFKSLKEDPQETANELLRTLIHLQDSSYPKPARVDFARTARDIRTNLAFFFSLSASLTGSFLAVMGKQWLANYEREERLQAPARRARALHLKVAGRQKYYFRGVMESLPTILQASLFVFLAGLSDLLWPLDKAIASCVIAFTATIFLVWTIITFVAAILPNFPYQSRLSIILSIILSTKKSRNKKITRTMTTPQNLLAIDIQIMRRLLKHMTFTDAHRLNTLADSLAAMPCDKNIRSLAKVMLEFHLEPLLVTKQVSWSCPQLRREFQVLGMMRIVRTLLANTSALTTEEHDILLGHVWLASLQTDVKPEVAEVIADIIALKAIQMEELRIQLLPLGPRPINCHNMKRVLASRLCSEAVKAGAKEGTGAAIINLFFHCLPPKYSDDIPFTSLLEQFATFFEGLPPDHPMIIFLSKTMMSFCFEGQLGIYRKDIQDLITETLSLNREARITLEHYLSIPMLRMVRVLFQSTSALQPDARADILSFLWQQFWLSTMKPERATAVAEILALCATDVESMRQGPASQWEAGCDPIHRPIVSTIFASSLFGRLATVDEKDRNSRASCLRLLHIYLPHQQSNTQDVFQNLLQTINDLPLPKEENAQTYLACLRSSLAETDGLAFTASQKSARLSVLLNRSQYHLPRLYGILDSHVKKTFQIPLSASALSVFMTLWYHRILSTNPTVHGYPLTDFYHPLWLTILRKWLQQDPSACGLDYFVPWQNEDWPEPVNKLTWLEGFSMMNYISRYLIEIFSKAETYRLTAVDIQTIRRDYKGWSEWLDNFVINWGQLGDRSVLRLGSKLEDVGKGVRNEEGNPTGPMGGGPEVGSSRLFPSEAGDASVERSIIDTIIGTSSAFPTQSPNGVIHEQLSSNADNPAQQAPVPPIQERIRPGSNQEDSSRCKGPAASTITQTSSHSSLLSGQSSSHGTRKHEFPGPEAPSKPDTQEPSSARSIPQNRIIVDKRHEPTALAETLTPSTEPFKP